MAGRVVGRMAARMVVRMVETSPSSRRFFVESLAEWLREWLRARGVELRRGPSVHHKVRVGCYATSTLTVTSCTGTS